ncbi:MAG: tetratricopeptide repeat protein [Anaerolineae bacterium]|nr:tetratricopeptide repeat protein [Anaerolineae bacterium]
MEFSEKPKKRNPFLRQRPSVIILEVLIVVVAVVAAGRFLFPATPPVPTRSAAELYAQGTTCLDALAYDCAITAYTDAIVAGYQPLSMAYFQRGRAHYGGQAYQRAIDDFTRSLQYDTACEHECHVDHYNRGLAYEKLGNSRAALDDFTQAIELKPDYAFAYRERGRLHYNQGRSAAGLRDWNLALTMMQTSVVRRGLTELGGTREGEIETPGEQVYFTFEGVAGTRVSLLTDALFDTVVLLRVADGNPLAFDDDGDGSDTRNARLSNLRLPSSGVYTAVVAAYDGESTGTFTLTLALDTPRASAPPATPSLTAASVATLRQSSQFNRSASGPSVWSLDGRFFVENDISRGVLLWDTLAAAPRFRQMIDVDKYYGALALTADNALLALAEGNMVLLYDVISGSRMAVLREPQETVQGLVFSPDGRWLAALGGYQEAFLWRTDATGRVYRLPTDLAGGQAIAFSPDSRLLALAGDAGALEVWTVSPRTRLYSLSVDTSQAVMSLAFSADGQRLLLGGSRGTVWLLETAAGIILDTFHGHRGDVNTVAFSPDGALLASGGADGTLRLWQPGVAAPLLVLDAHEDEIQTLAFRTDNRSLATAGADGTVRLWQAAE